MKILKWLNDYIEEAILLIIGTVMVTITILQVFMRMSGNSLTWSEELARYCFVWIIYIGLSYGVKKQKHINIDIILILLKGKANLVLRIISDILFLCFCLIVVYYGTDLVQKQFQFGQTSAGMGLPIGYVYLAAPVGAALCFIRLLQNLWSDYKNLKERKDRYGTDPQN